MMGLNAVAFVSPTRGWAIGTLGVVMGTTDGGRSWLAERSQTSGAQALNGVFFVNSLVGYVVGNRGVIVKTTDGGFSWTSLSSGIVNPLYGVAFTDANNGRAVGATGLIISTTNGGATWNRHPSGTSSMFRAIGFAPGGTSWLVGRNSVILKNTSTTDARFGRSAVGASTIQLEYCYPNPFNPSAHVAFVLSDDLRLNIRLYNVLGQEVRTLVEDAEMPAGQHMVRIDGSDLATGVYFCRIGSADGVHQAILKVVYLK
jgi:hypothetical protein